jgi:hypothetical protein
MRLRGGAPRRRPPRPQKHPLRLWKRTGCGKLRATTHPRTFPHPSEILGARPPPAQDSRSSHNRGGDVL